jgi:hypothetical protein
MTTYLALISLDGDLLFVARRAFEEQFVGIEDAISANPASDNGLSFVAE